MAPSAISAAWRSRSAWSGLDALPSVSRSVAIVDGEPTSPIHRSGDTVPGLVCASVASLKRRVRDLRRGRQIGPAEPGNLGGGRASYLCPKVSADKSGGNSDRCWRRPGTARDHQPRRHGQDARQQAGSPAHGGSRHSRLAHMMTEARQLAVHPAVSPGGILRRQPQHQVADLLSGRRAAQPTRAGPLAGDQTTVPGQQSPRRDQPTAVQRGRQQPGQRGQYRPVSPVRPGRAACRRSTISSWRSTMISAFLDAWLRLSRTSQPKSRTVIKYTRRKDGTDRDHASTSSRTPTAAQGPCGKF
jgi:hypothetical protein